MGRNLKWGLLGALGVLLSTACGTQQPPDGGPGGGPPGPSNNEEEEPGIGHDAIKPNVMLLIDRSGSMAQPGDCGEAMCASKWEQLLALGPYLAEVKRSARLGLALFPAESSLVVPLSDADDVDEQMMSVVTSVQPGGQTPVAAALHEMARVGALDDYARDNILLVLTDGQPNCVCESSDVACVTDAAVEAVEALVKRTPPVDVDIIGFGSSAQNAHDTLTAMAQAAGDEGYYQANDVEELIGTLTAVASTAVPCSFSLDETPPPERLIVWVDDERVDACPAEPCDAGYTYDRAAGLVELRGASCDAIRDGAPHHVWFDEEPE